MLVGILIITICFVVLFDKEARNKTQVFLDNTLGVLFKKGKKGD